MASNNKAAEIVASESFIEKFKNKYGEHAVPLYVNTLESLDARACSDELNIDCLVILYLHVDNHQFSFDFCSHLQNKELVESITKNNCFLLAWDLSVSEELEFLIDSVRCTLGYGVVYQNLKLMKPSVFLIRPIEHDVIKCIDSILHLKHFPFTLDQIIASWRCKGEEIIKDEIDHQNDAAISSERFQQMMFEYLGDRDFDSFECDEHEYLKNKIYFAIYGAPDTLERDKERDKVVNDLYNLIRKINNKYSKWNDRIVTSFLYNCTESLQCVMANMTPIPLFVIRKCKGSSNPCRKFIDLDLRVYGSWRRYLRKNKLPSCNMVVPKNGRYRGDSLGNVILETHRSPQCTNSAYVLKLIDIAATVLAIFAAILMVGSFIYPPIAIPAGILGVICAVYSMTRSSFQIHDRRKHRMNMSIKNPDARGAYFNIAANSIGIVGGALTRTVTIVASRGVAVGKSILLTVNTINYAGLATDVLGLMNAVHALKGSKRPDALQILQFSFSLLFFNNSIITLARTKGRLVQSEISTAIRNNKTGYPPANGQTITHLRSVHSQDVMKILGVRNNRLSAAKLITFSNQKGNISLNNVPVTVLKQTVVKFQGLSLPPVQYITEVIQKKFLTNEENVRLYADILYLFPKQTQDCIIKITESLLTALKEEDVQFPEATKKIFPHSTFTCKVLEVVVLYLENRHWKECQNASDDQENKARLFRMIEAIGAEDTLIIELVQFYLNWLTTAIYEHEYANINRVNRRQNQLNYKTKVDCNICGGYYYKTAKK